MNIWHRIKYNWLNDLIILLSFMLLLATAWTASAEELIKVPVLSMKANRGSVITDAQLEFVEMEADRIGDNIITEPEKIVGKQAVRTIQQGRKIYNNYVRDIPDVSKDSDVRMLFTKAGLKLTATGVSVEDGLIGQKIKVINDESGKMLFGTVIAKNTVEIND